MTFLTILLALTSCLTPTYVFGEEASEQVGVCEGVLVTPLLYKAEKDGKTTYLLGTTHIGVSLDRFPERIKQLISSSDVLVKEMAPVKTWFGKVIIQVRLLTSIFRLGGPKLSEVLSPEAVANFKIKLADKKQPEYLVDLLTPAGAAIMLSMDIKDLEKGQLDEEIESYARSCKLKIKSLEKAYFQAKKLKHICTIEDLEESLTAKDEAKINGKEKQTSDAFVEGDQEAFEEKYRQYEKKNSIFFKDMIVARNQDWIPKIKKFHDSKRKHFIIFGALHLPGGRGVLQLLEREGFKITRVIE